MPEQSDPEHGYYVPRPLSLLLHGMCILQRGNQQASTADLSSLRLVDGWGTPLARFEIRMLEPTVRWDVVVLGAINSDYVARSRTLPSVASRWKQTLSLRQRRQRGEPPHSSPKAFLLVTPAARSARPEGEIVHACHSH
jgi:hypothetical protein